MAKLEALEKKEKGMVKPEKKKAFAALEKKEHAAMREKGKKKEK